MSYFSLHCRIEEKAWEEQPMRGVIYCKRMFQSMVQLKEQGILDHAGYQLWQIGINHGALTGPRATSCHE